VKLFAAPHDQLTGVIFLPSPSAKFKKVKSSNRNRKRARLPREAKPKLEEFCSLYLEQLRKGSDMSQQNLETIASYIAAGELDKAMNSFPHNRQSLFPALASAV
jgi:hypothetical protein